MTIPLLCKSHRTTWLLSVLGNTIQNGAPLKPHIVCFTQQKHRMINYAV